MTYCCDELELAIAGEWIEWTARPVSSPKGWLIWVGSTGEYSILTIKHCPFCGTELENREEMR